MHNNDAQILLHAHLSFICVHLQPATCTNNRVLAV